LLKTSATTSSGNPKDKFHFVYPTSQWESLSQSNTEVGYGVQFEILSQTPPREVVIVYTESGSAASQAPANLGRGATILAIDAVDMYPNDSNGIRTINAGLSPATAGESHTFRIEDRGSTTPRDVILTAANVTSKSVALTGKIATATGTVGYLL